MMERMNPAFAGRNGLIVCGALACAFSMAGCTRALSTKPLQAEPQVVESLHRYTKEYVLEAGDSLDVVVYRNPELSRQALIRSDGVISLPILGDVKVAGMTTRQLDDLLAERLRARLVNPEVTVSVTNAREPMVYVVGEVQAATPIPLRDAKTAAQAIARVSLLSRSVDLSHVSIIRLDDTGHIRAYPVRPQEHAQPAPYMALQNVPLQADDLIFVPESKRSQATRAVQDFATMPLSALNLILTPYFQYRIIQDVLK